MEKIWNILENQNPGWNYSSIMFFANPPSPPKHEHLFLLPHYVKIVLHIMLYPLVKFKLLCLLFPSSFFPQSFFPFYLIDVIWHMARSNGLLPVRKWSNQTFAFLASALPLFCKRSLYMNHDLHLDSICTLYP